MSGISYITLGTNDLARATAFYDQLLAIIGGRRVMPTPHGFFYSFGRGTPGLMLTTPYDGGPATVGNGTMLALGADSPDQVAALHAKALELGGTCEGQPGPRGTFGTFAYFRDLDGNKLCAAKVGT